jgi:catechol 2,3-dioxygenase-like lactoylglutathione lyase family enzyme
MTVQLDHTIVQAKDKTESATFLADVLGLPAPVPTGPFMAVDVDNAVSIDFADVDGDIVPHHYAFCVSDPEFDAIFSRIRVRALPYWADPRRSRPDEIRRIGHARGFYFEDPSGHFLEVLTRPEDAA